MVSIFIYSYSTDSPLRMCLYFSQKRVFWKIWVIYITKIYIYYIYYIYVWGYMLKKIGVGSQDLFGNQTNQTQNTTQLNLSTKFQKSVFLFQMQRCIPKTTNFSSKYIEKNPSAELKDTSIRTRVSLAITCNPFLPNISKIIRKNWNILSVNESLKKNSKRNQLSNATKI